MVISIDANYEMDLFVSASKTKCTLRVISTMSFFRTIKPKLTGSYQIYKVLLSARGYIVLQLRSYIEQCNVDIIQCYSINGEFVAETKLDENVNAILFDKTQYFLVIYIKKI